MSSEWRETTLGKICEEQGGSIQTGPFGSQLHTSDYKELGFPVVMPTNLGEGGIDQSGIARIGADDVERLSQHKLKVDDIVFSRRGDVTKNALVRHHEAGWLCGTGCLKVRLGDESIASPKFISHCLRMPEIKEWLIRHAVGATMPNLNTGILASVPIRLPPLDVQLGISILLGALDDRITLLRETNATLEAIAQALFKSWFVDFDPVHANAAAKADQHSGGNGQTGTSPGSQTDPAAQRTPQALDPATAALFPDSFEESELGLVPKGWRVKPIGDVVDCLGGGTPDTKESSYWEPAEHAWTTPKDLSGLQSPVLLSTERKLSTLGLAKVSSGLLPAGTLLLSSRAPIGYLAIAQMPVAVNQGYIAIPRGGELPPIYMLFWCRQNMDGIKNRANGSTFMEISKKAFRPIPALVPSAEVLGAFANIADPLFERLVENERQAQTLTQLRDTLLPRLISGQLRLPDTEQAINEALA